MKYYYRVCFKNGVRKRKNTLFEFHKLCECPDCKYRYEVLHQHKNKITLLTNTKEKFAEVEEYLDHWTCKNKDKYIGTEYVHLMEE